MKYEKITETTWLDRTGEAPYLFFPVLRELGIRHGFSTRIGGVSSGCYATMNLGFNRGDSDENVTENYRRICASIGIVPDDLVFTDQVHKTNVRLAHSADKGKGYNRKRDYSEIDGHITDEENLPLLVFSADCVPLYFVDPVKRAIGLSHSGWKGTADKIGAVTVNRMNAEFGSDRKDIVAVIGPSIGPECYEVGEEVKNRFQESYDPEQIEELFVPSGSEGKWYLNLWEANRQTLLRAGLPDENIIISGVCSALSPELLFSHRKYGAKRGSMAAFLSL